MDIKTFKILFITDVQGTCFASKSNVNRCIIYFFMLNSNINLTMAIDLVLCGGCGAKSKDFEPSRVWI